MFLLKLDDRVEEITSSSLKFIGKPSSALPAVLKRIANLSRGEWYSAQDLEHLGPLDNSELESLVRARLLCFGLGSTAFPLDGRLFYEMQFPDHAAAYPLKDWLCNPFSINTIWVGLPFCHLTHIRHSTALGLANVIDHLDGGSVPFLGVFPFMNPSELCIEHLCRVSSIVSHTTKRLGVLGGDHRVAWVTLRALRSTMKKSIKLRYLHIDAHHDLYGSHDEIPSDAIAHSNFLLDLLAKKTIDEAVLIGCRDEPTPIARAIDRGFPIISVPEYQQFAPTALKETKHTHLSVDLDILDPTIAPNVSSPINDGWSFEHLITTIRCIMRTETVDSVSFVEADSISHTGSTSEKILSVLSE